MTLSRLTIGVLTISFFSHGAIAQQEAPPGEEVTMIASSWALLAQGKVAEAAVEASKTLQQYPRSAAALSLAVETETRRAGAFAGLDVYERWLGSRRLDDAYVLRRVAKAVLFEASNQPLLRLEALKLRAADGDAEADAELLKGATSGNYSETRALAQLGDERAVKLLLGELNGQQTSKMNTINALVESGSKLAVPALIGLLGDQMHPDHRAAAADGLGRLGARDTIDKIKPLLDDPDPMVQYSAAAALYRLEDMSGLPILLKQLEYPEPVVRINALAAMSSHPDANWLSLVREAVRSNDPYSRQHGAELLAPYDPDAARAVLEGLMQDNNLAVRELAGQTMAQRVAADFATLRRMLRNPDGMTKLRAAGRMLELTR